MTSLLSPVAEMPRLAHGTEHQALLHSPYEQTQTANAVSELLGMRTHKVQVGETVAQVARSLGVLPPVSLFRVVPGQQWQVNNGFMTNIVSGTSFPIQSTTSASNDEQQYTLVA